MADELSDAEKIRNKRLAKLSSQSSASNSDSQEEIQSSPANSNDTSRPNPSNAKSPTPSAPAPTAPPKINITPQRTHNPFSQLGLRAAPERSPTGAPAAAPQKPSNGPPQPKKQSKSLDEWEDGMLSHVFRFTVHPERAKFGHQYFLQGLHNDLQESDSTIRLSTAHLEEALMEAAPNQGRLAPLDYILTCWKRLLQFNKNMRPSDAEKSKLAIMQEARRLCFSDAIFAATLPDMFGQPSPPPLPPFAKHLLLDPSDDRGIDHEFLTEAISRSEEDETILGAIVEGMEHLSRQLATMSMNEDYVPYIAALRRFVRYPRLAIALTESPFFLPQGTPAQLIERQTFLGSFFSISPMQPVVAQSYFSSPKTRDRGSILQSQGSLRITLRTHQDELFDIVNRFIKVSKESRSRVLDWFALCVNTNHKRRAMRPDPRYISSDAFMVNVTVILDMLSEPFMDAAFSKINRIEAEYFRRPKPRVDIKDETKINADQEKSNEFYSQKIEGESNFISEVFFLTVGAHHYGTEAVNAKLSSLRRDLKEMEKQLERFEEERQKVAHNPMMLSRFEETLKKYKDQVEKGHCAYLAIEGVLLDELSQARSMSFMRYVIVWLVRLVSGADFPKKSISLPLLTEQPDVFRCLPEYFIEDVVDHFKFLTSHMPQVISPTQCDELVMVCITFLRSSEYIKNPYLKSGLVTILFYGVMPLRNHAKGILGDLLNSLPFALNHLLHSLMKFYIECESTGAHTQFYDKFNIRYEIFQVIKCIWSNPVYREHLATEASVNVDFFVHFVNLLLNDVTFVLDESFTSFNKISTLQRELRTSAGSMDENARNEKQEALEEAQRKAKSYMQLTTESIATLKLFTDALAESFTSPEVVQRLADMLDYNLDSLVGPKQRELKVESPEEYDFNPKMLVSDIFDVYLNLSEKPSFHRAIARDGRSYKPENFDHAAYILSKYALKSSSEQARWKKLGAAVRSAKEEENAEEEDLGEPPDEFVDPLLSTLMVDPVTLPISKSVMDRSTIRQHLLSDPHDPFNRSSLKIEDVIPNTELKEQIESWKRERKALRNRDAANAMDTSE